MSAAAVNAGVNLRLIVALGVAVMLIGVAGLAGWAANMDDGSRRAGRVAIAAENHVDQKCRQRSRRQPGENQAEQGRHRHCLRHAGGAGHQRVYGNVEAL